MWSCMLAAPSFLDKFSKKSKTIVCLIPDENKPCLLNCPSPRNRIRRVIIEPIPQAKYRRFFSLNVVILSGKNHVWHVFGTCISNPSLAQVHDHSAFSTELPPVMVRVGSIIKPVLMVSTVMIGEVQEPLSVTLFA